MTRVAPFRDRVAMTIAVPGCLAQPALVSKQLAAKAGLRASCSTDLAALLRRGNDGR